MHLAEFAMETESDIQICQSRLAVLWPGKAAVPTGSAVEVAVSRFEHSNL